MIMNEIMNEEARYIIGSECETADTYFRWISCGYCDDYPEEAFDRIIAILHRERKDKAADYVTYYFSALEEEKKFKEDSRPVGDRFVSVNQIKVDYLGGYKGSEEKVYFEDETQTITVSASFEREDGVFICIDKTSIDKHGSTVVLIPWNKFKTLSQKDFERLLNEAIFYIIPDEMY